MEKTQLAINLPAHFYTDPEIFVAEREAIFKRSWQLVCAVDRLRRPGDFVTLRIAGVGVYLIRGQDNEIRGFRNACRHRGAQLLEGDGNCATVRCPYHDWHYDDRGSLLDTPWFGEPTPFDVAGLKLDEISVGVWRTLVFAAIAPDRTLLEQLGDFPTEVQALQLEGYATAEWQTFRGEDVNWKAYLDQFTENYHVPRVHSPDKSMEIWKYTADAYDGIVVLRAPAGGLYFGGRWVWGWPNWTLSTFPGGIKLSRIEALSPHSFDIHYQYLFEDLSDRKAVDRRKVIDATAAIFRDDLAASRLVQINYDSGNYRPGPLHPDLERGVAYLQSRVRGAVEQVLKGGAA